MYSGQIFVKTFFPTRPNPNYISFELNNIQNNHALIKYVHTIRGYPITEMKNMRDLAIKIKNFCATNHILRTMKNKFNSVPRRLKNQSVNCVKTWTRQCEFVSAQQIRRSQQMFCLYTKLWEERALSEFFRVMRQHIFRRGKHFMFGAVGISVFDWEKYRIEDDEIDKHLNDFAYIAMLQNNNFVCTCCKKKKAVDFADPETEYCECPGDPQGKIYKDNWEPYLERQNLMVWRRTRPDGCYEYKVYGSYNDVTAKDFLEVQIDTDYRKQWDTTAVKLEIVESEPDTNSDIVYWEMLWPRLFSNRDYVFNRRFLIKEKENMIFLYSKGTHHPSCPVKSDKYRIEDYYSCMVIRPTTSLDEPGIEFSLTYFDNPGVNIPAAVTSWVAMAAMPDFLEKLRIAAKEYKEYCAKNIKLDEENKKQDDKRPAISPTSVESPPTMLCNEMGSDVSQSESNAGSYWRYLHPHYYFG